MSVPYSLYIDSRKCKHSVKMSIRIVLLFDNSETTLKRFKQDKNSIYLIPENDEMEPIIISGRDRERLIIQGEAIMVMKDL